MPSENTLAAARMVGSAFGLPIHPAAVLDPTGYNAGYGNANR